jgi:4-methoxybenzoate monooxygenase (O-demethylating)
VSAPESDLDPYSDDFLADPYPAHESLREAGAAVRMTKYGVWALARYQEVHAALSDRRSYAPSAGPGIRAADPPLEAKARAVLARILSPVAVRRLRDALAIDAEELADDLVDRGRFDAVADLAETYPVNVFPDALGLAEEGRENLVAPSEPTTARVWIASKCRRDQLVPGSFGALIYEAADRGQIGAEEASQLVQAFLSAGVETTVNGLGAAVWAFVRYPEAWALLHQQPILARQAFDEVLRWDSPVQILCRTTRRVVTRGLTRIGEGEQVLLFLGAANRDPRRWPQPERFDILRATAGHVAFGGGIHGCVGQVLARMQAELILGALARRVDRIDLAGEPCRRRDNAVRAFASLPVEVHRS